MLLRDILNDITVYESGQPRLSKPCSDHRTFKENDVFVAIKGSNFDGHVILDKILMQKPLAVVVEDDSFLKNASIPYIKVTSTRKALDILAHHWFNKPSSKLFCVGITGTNGKTTTAHMVEHALNSTGLSTGVIGTINHHLVLKDGSVKIWPTQLTTPGSLEFYERLKEFNEMGANALSVEVSSHALDQDRMSSCEFDIGIFTNLTLDHLDYHKTMDAYFHAKEKFFSEILLKSPKDRVTAIINIDDPYGKKLNVPSSVRKLTYGKDKGADLNFEIIKQDFSGQYLKVNYKNNEKEVRLLVSGLFNVYNFLAALGVLFVRSVEFGDALKVFENFNGVKGRLQKVISSSEKHVFVDYAHTPDALENVITTLNQLKNKNKLITVVGCGGDRDKSKRPVMGEIACRLSDRVIITSDNPRTEDPNKILEDIQKGCVSYSNYSMEVDRKKAISMAISYAQKGDAVLIAGKGHEDYQILGTEKIYFSDYEVALECLSV